MKYKVGDRVWWHGSRLYIVVDNGGFYLTVKSDYYNGEISRKRVKPIITLKAELA